MKMSMKRFADDAASKSRLDPRLKPIGSGFGSSAAVPTRPTSGLVEEAAALQQAGAFFGRDLDVAGCQEKDLVGHTLHAAVEGVRETAREVDQALRKLLVRALE